MAKDTEARLRGPARALTDQVANRLMAPTKARAPWTLSPSDLTFLWGECPRCFYMKVVLKQPRPRSPFPKVFGLIDRAMKNFYLGERTDALVDGMPLGVLGGGDRWVKSSPIPFPGSDSSCLIRGRLDVLIDCDDGTTAIVDFKTSEPRAVLVEKYAHQLRAYALAIEHPASGLPATVSALGLLCFSPSGYKAKGPRAALHGDLRWIEIERNDQAFSDFLTQVVSVLERPEPPAPSPTCVWCSWRPDAAAVA